LYEADYNMAMGLKWSAAMALSEQHQQLNTGQYGSRQSRGAQDPVFIEEFQLRNIESVQEVTSPSQL
jgi:hypothetical protein